MYCVSCTKLLLSLTEKPLRYSLIHVKCQDNDSKNMFCRRPGVMEIFIK